MLLPLIGVLVAIFIIYLVFGFLITFTAIAAFVLIILFTDIGKKKEKVYSIEVGKKVENETIPRRHPAAAKELFSGAPDNCGTLYEVFRHGYQKANNGKGDCFGTRAIKKQGDTIVRGEYEWETYEQVQKRFLNLGAGLMKLGMKKGSRLGLYSENRAEWMIASEAANAYSFITVSIYDTLGVEHRQFIIDQSEIHTIITKQNHLKNIFDIRAECPKLENVVIFESEISEQDKKKAEALKIGLYTYAEVEALGKANPKDPVPPSKKDLATIMYTSGTTARPKGVLLTHESITSVIAGVCFVLPEIGPNDIYFSYLPLAHILERAAEAYVIFNGGRIGFFQGDIRKFPEDVKLLKPTMFAGVPKVFQRVMNNIKAQVEAKGGASKAIFNFAFAIKKLSIEYGFSTGLLDKIVFQKVREGLGGRVRIMLTGGAPCSYECHQFIRICFGCPLMQGYGSTETCGGSSVTAPEMINPYKKAGGPLPCCEIKLVDGGNYTTNSPTPQGEICISGPSISIGYYKMEEQTKKDFRQHKSDGKTWFHTGDVGEWNKDGTLSIIGRVKDIFKLDTGEYVAPERLETLYAGSSLVANIFVFGESDKSFLIAVVVPDAVAAEAWAKKNGISKPSDAEDEDVKPPNVPKWLTKNEQLKKDILADLKSIAEKAKLNRYEYIANLYLDNTFWVPDTGLVTDALKNKRFVLEKHFKKELNQLYSEPPLVT